MTTVVFFFNNQIKLAVDTDKTASEIEDFLTLAMEPKSSYTTIKIGNYIIRKTEICYIKIHANDTQLERSRVSQTHKISGNA